MAVVAQANPYSALAVRLLSFAEILAFVSTPGGYVPTASTVDRAKPRISSVLQKSWLLPCHAILIRKAGGPPPHRETGLHTSRADLWLYGPGENAGTQEREAYRLWSTVGPALMPTNGDSDMFAAAGCVVDGVTLEAEPIPFVDTDTGWRVMVAPVLIGWGSA